MERTLGLILGVILSFGLVFGLCSCHMEESYKEFNIVNITDFDEEDYFDSDELDFARIKGVVIVPEIKEIDWGEYIIYIAAYSKEKMGSITIKDVTLTYDGNNFLNEKLDQDIVLKINQDDVYEGDVVGGIFTDDDVDISHGKELLMQVQVQVGDKAESQVKVINYDISITVYKTWVLPT